MSIQRRINKRHIDRQPPPLRQQHLRFKAITVGCPPEAVNKPDKGHKDGSCNRTACQQPLADETHHQFMEGVFTGGPRIYYCASCAFEFDKWDLQSGDRIRINRELKEPAQ